MAELPAAFDSNQHEDMRDGFDPIPKDKYKCAIKESDVKTNSKKTGKYISLGFEVIAGEFKGRKFWTNLNIQNPNPVTVEIAEKEFATICRACGKGVVQNTDVLHNIPMEIKVGIKPAKGDYPAGNKPLGYKAIGSTTQQAKGFGDEEPDQVEGSESTSVPPEDDGEVPWGDDDE